MKFKAERERCFKAPAEWKLNFLIKIVRLTGSEIDGELCNRVINNFMLIRFLSLVASELKEPFSLLAEALQIDFKYEI